MAGMGDLKQVEREQNRRLNALITKACADAFASTVNRGNCSAFVRDVGRRLGITIIGQQANDIYFEIQRAPWALLGIGNQGALKAPYQALQGFLVVAAWRNPSGNGHVAIVHDLRDLSSKIAAISDRNIAASWGVLDTPHSAQLNGRIRDSFSTTKLASTVYAARFITRFGDV
jgi:hypothetical protein